jgi:beta-glucosidase
MNIHYNWSLIFFLWYTFLYEGHSSIYPKDFAWGTATSAYQIEGAWNVDNRGPSIWDNFSHAGKCRNGDTGDQADDHYHKYEEDVQLIKSLNVGWYRFSISWSRIYPTGVAPSNSDGVNFYTDLIEELLANNIKPFVTLYHWDLPQALQDKGGWLSSDTVDAFVNYADFCFQTFGKHVTRWLTINEPYVVAWLGNGLGIHAPGRCTNRAKCSDGNSTTEPYIVAHNLLLAHAKAVDVYRTKYQKIQNGTISITLNSDWAVPLSQSQSDSDAAERYMQFMLGWFADPLYFGDYPSQMRTRVGENLPTFTFQEQQLLQKSHDFFGLNHYTSLYATDFLITPPPPDIVGWERDSGVNTTRYKNRIAIGLPSDSAWLYVVPTGFRSLLKWIKNRYRNPEIIVTENGVSVPNESVVPMTKALDDQFRVNYYQSYLEEMEKSISIDNVTISGYFAWSLLDNFEWADGYSVRFGLFYVDYKTLARHPKASTAFYSNYILDQSRVPDSEWWFLAFLAFPGFIVLVTVCVCIIHENRTNPSSDYTRIEQ